MRTTDYARRSTGRVFCSAACRNLVGSKPRTVPEKVCERCGVTFRPLQRTAVGRFCSKACQYPGKVTCTCEWCGKNFELFPARTTGSNTGQFCSNACKGAAAIKHPLDREHNGKPAVLTAKGYVEVWQPDHPNAKVGGWIAEHRLVASRTLGRPLGPDEEVHHIDLDRQNNDPANLLPLTIDQHHALHATLRRAAKRKAVADAL